jgi:polyhydroxyalkanoate synthase
MFPFPIQIRPDVAALEAINLNQRFIKGAQTLTDIRREDVRVGPTTKEEVYREDNLRLYRFTPVSKRLLETPVVIVYALVNRPYLADLQEDRSLVRNLLELGVDVYLIDWGYAGRADRWLSMDDYINGYIDNCIDAVRDRHGLDQINMIGICQGGTFSLCYCALHPRKVKNLVTMVTPVDFHVEEGLLNVWAQSLDADLMVDALGNIPGDFMNLGFVTLKPLRLSVAKYLGLMDHWGDREKLLDFLRMEKWIFDSPDQAGEAFRQFIKDFYQANKLVKGEVEIGGRRVDLKSITMPVLNLYGEFDDLVPPRSSLALEQRIGSQDYTALSFPVGHIGMYVSSKVQRDLPPTIAGWLSQRP